MTDLYIEYIPLKKLVKMDRNPKLHSQRISKSFERYGYVEPVLIDEGSGKLVAGHGRLEHLEDAFKRDKQNAPDRLKLVWDNATIIDWAVPVIRGVKFRSQDEAEEYGITSNLLVIEGGFDEAELEALIEATNLDPIGIEADAEGELAQVLGEIATEAVIAEADVEDEVEDHAEYDAASGSDDSAAEDADGGTTGDTDTGAEGAEDDRKLSDEQWYDQLPFELKGVAQLVEEAYFLPEEDSFAQNCIGELNDDLVTSISGVNRLGIPNLRPDMLVQELPKNLKVWGDRLSTPLDEKSTWFWNYGATPPPMKDDRKSLAKNIIVSFFTHDNHIDSWWATPAYRVGQLLVAGVKDVVVPDYSLWDFAPVATHIWSLYRAAWLGRYFQEAGLNVIPRLEFFQEKSKPYALLGIPYYAPVVATQFQTGFEEENIPQIEKNLKDALKILRPKHLLIYASKKGREMVEKFDLPCDITVLSTSSELRKKAIRHKEDNPHLLEIRKRSKRGKEARRATTPEK